MSSPQFFKYRSILHKLKIGSSKRYPVLEGTELSINNFHCHPPSRDRQPDGVEKRDHGLGNDQQAERVVQHLSVHLPGRTPLEQSAFFQVLIGAKATTLFNDMNRTSRATYPGLYTRPRPVGRPPRAFQAGE
ncbi:hypothetical protein PGT21_021000 [Puccinia graminis f. sp. tritici]|uniref:Uncharacterized protein n=1 Tax=Puccinia graminis f. sp. tritici TaxID=56615 RepID=A0A5B0SCZ5_PUCGR|nr:hypothetical protein PGTUg99_016388 [Puccinia graminis f. sp. tritici]KAA1105824.1 hypothetical protein PGT21_021000 [Puccinia graminis f. sp. tritici]KAA1135093.1 hypothetical protein PGTUg99_007732 [Puccinia graminis f. sp. tritici]